MAASAPFRKGTKEVFLPNFTIALLNTNPSRLPPTFARFAVPLSMNKLDMRDYLYHAYDIRTVSIRSYVEQAKVREGRPNAIKHQRNRWFRARATKRMTVEMEAPFVWPAQPESYDEWGKEAQDKARAEEEEGYKKARLPDTHFSETDRMSLAEQAKRLVEGKERWRAGLGVASRRA